MAFPVGHLAKAQVRALAARAGLPSAARRSSAGICFIGTQPRSMPHAHHEKRARAAKGRTSQYPCCCFPGRRDFGEFIEAYAPPIAGRFLDVDSGADLGACPNLAAVTHGQGAGISGLPEKCARSGRPSPHLPGAAPPAFRTYLLRMQGRMKLSLWF